jgi:hypothetical protein
MLCLFISFLLCCVAVFEMLVGIPLQNDNPGGETLWRKNRL